MGDSQFDRMIADVAARSKQMQAELSSHGYRIFSVRIDAPTIGQIEPDGWLWIHGAKTVEQWRRDILDFVEEAKVRDDDGRAHENVENALSAFLCGRGYLEVADVVADAFDGRVATSEASLLPNPSGDTTVEGFGDFGHEAGQVDGPAA
jgi:hypothetical protein